MSDYQKQDFEVIAKEITIALIQKCDLVNQDLSDFACNTFDQVYKQIYQTVIKGE